jgi:predicted transcriptional regulator
MSGIAMAAIKISSKVEEETWEALRELANDSRQSISGVLTEAISEYIQRRRVRPEVRTALVDSIRENQRLGELLAK